MAAMLTVLNKRWISQGWRAMDPEDAEPMALVWIEIMDKAGVPWQQYGVLYHKAVMGETLRARGGEKVEPFSSIIMASYWPELREEIRQREIERGRTLTAHAETTCPLCFGTGKEYRFENGRPVGVTGRVCDHNGAVDTPYMLDGQPATFADFKRVQERNRLAVVEQAKAAEPTAEDILRELADQVHREMFESTDVEERALLRDTWLKLLRAAKEARAAEG